MIWLMPCSQSIKTDTWIEATDSHKAERQGAEGWEAVKITQSLA